MFVNIWRFRNAKFVERWRRIVQEGVHMFIYGFS